MPVITQNLANEKTPWFGTSRQSVIVRKAVELNTTVSSLLKSPKLSKGLPKLTKKEATEAIEMYNDWRGEVAVKVRAAIDISSHSGLGRRSIGF